MTFRERTAYARKQKKMIQADLGKAISTSGDIIGKYERNENSPSVEMALKIARVFDVPVDYLLGEGKHAAYDKNTIKRIEDIEALPQDEKDKIYYFIDMAITHHKTKKAFAK